MAARKARRRCFPDRFTRPTRKFAGTRSGDPAKVDNDDLLKRARLLASTCLFARYWPGNGARHDAALSLGGFLARAGLKAPQVKYLVEAIAKAAGDAEHQGPARIPPRTRHRHFTPESLRADIRCSAKPSARRWPSRSPSGWSIAAQPATTAQRSAQEQPLSNDIVTEQSAARQFADEHGDQFRYCRSARQVVFLERRHLDQGRARRRLPLGRPAFEPPGRGSKRRNPQEPRPGGVRERRREVRPTRSETGHDCGGLEQRPDVAGNAGRNGGLANGRASDEPPRGLHHENDRAWRRSTSPVRAGSSS